MRDALVASYPRRHGVVVPALLTRAGCAVMMSGNSRDGRVRAAAEVVRWVRGLLRDLPAEVLDVSLPDPEHMLRSWSLGARTRRALDRLCTRGKHKKHKLWHVRALLGALHLGPVALVDVLAAREENEHETMMRRAPHAAVTMYDRSASARPRKLDDIGALIAESLPLRSDELGALLLANQLTPKRLDADEVTRLYRDWDLAIPFRVVRRGGTSILVAPTSVNAVEALVSAALHTIFHWGLSSLSTVLERVRSTAAAEMGAAAVARVLAAIPRFCWLDETSGWFSFVGSSSRLVIAVRKVFAIADRVPFIELVDVLAKRARVVSTAPTAALESYLATVAACEVRDGWVQPRLSLVPAPLTRGERLVVEILRRSGGRLTRKTLTSRAFALGARPTTLRELLRTSPLVVEDAQELRLVGSSVGS